MRDNCHYCSVGTEWQSWQCSVAVLVVRFVSHRTISVHKVKIFEARNSKDINKFIILSLNIYCREQNCDLLGYYAAGSVNLIPTFRDKQTLSSSRVFLTLSGSSLLTFRDNPSVVSSNNIGTW